MEALGQAICAARLLAREKLMDQSEKRKEIGRPLILCLFRMSVLDGGLKVKVLGVFCP